MSVLFIHTRRFMLAVLLVLAVALVSTTRHGNAQEGWVIRSFDVHYSVAEDGRIDAAEDILVDFGTSQKHGIYRDIPVEYGFDSDNNRLMSLTAVHVDDGAAPVPFETSRIGGNLRIKIGDPDLFVNGQQRYRISYTINDGLNPFADHDEFYWNVTGANWPVVIEQASATVQLPRRGIQQVDCFEGPTGSTQRCTSSSSRTVASFRANSRLFPGAQLTLVVGIDKGVIAVGTPVLVDANVDPVERVQEVLGVSPWTVAVSAVFVLAAIGLLASQWWAVGRDRWFGDQYYFTDEPPTVEQKPLFSHETVVVEYEPPPEGPDGRRLRPAEVGVLLDERADTLDVSATIVDLAVRKYLRIEETGHNKYEFERLEAPGGDTLLPYEKRLLNALADEGETVRLDDLKNKFYEDLAKVKSDLYKQATSRDKFFPRNPESVRGLYAVAGLVVAVVGVGLTWLVGTAAGVGLFAVPVVVAGGILALTSRAMPRRTAKGRQAYRRSLGFRTFVTAGDTGEYRFAEEAHIFEEYLPYAIVFKSAKKWAERFEALGIEPETSGWYVGSQPFRPVLFATSIRDFSSSVGSTLASTPGGSGGSGFSGGGFSGGGGGGGGGGSW